MCHLVAATNYLSIEIEVVIGIYLKPRPNYHIDWAIARSMWQGRGLRFLVKTEHSMLTSCSLHGFLLCLCRPVIGQWELLENNVLQLDNQSARYIGHKHKPYNKGLVTTTTDRKNKNLPASIKQQKYITPCIF